MGEVTDMILDGLLCEECGAYIEDDEEPGHPRKCPDCGDDTVRHESSKTKKKKQKANK